MQAVTLHAFGSPENFHTSQLPLPEPRAGEVRIRVKAAAFNPVDYKYRQGRFGGDLPMLLGIDCAGVIDALGERTNECNQHETLAVGDEVYAYLGHPESGGTYAEYTCTAAAFVAKKPRNVGFAEAASIPLAGLTAYQAVMNKDILASDRSVFVAGGSGGVGTFTIQLLQYLGANPIITTAGSKESYEHLTSGLGLLPENVIRYRGLTVEQMARRVMELNGGRPTGAALDFVGGNMKRLCCLVIGFEGRVVSIVEEPPGFELNVWNASRSPLFARSASLHFEFVGARALFGNPESWLVYNRQLRAIADLVEQEYLHIPKPRIMGKLSAETVAAAHGLLESGHASGKLVMTVE